MVRLARFERATFGSGDRRSSPAELQAHVLIIRNITEIWKTKKSLKRASNQHQSTLFTPAAPPHHRFETGAHMPKVEAGIDVENCAEQEQPA